MANTIWEKLNLDLRAGETHAPIDERQPVFFDRQILKGDIFLGGKCRDCFEAGGQFQI